MRVLIIEDEAPAYRRLNKLLTENHSDFEVIEVIDSVVDSIKWLRNHQSPDLIFSDIQLADGLSFRIYEAFQVSCPIIFTTAYDEYMLEAFSTNGIDYLLKPIQLESLNRSVSKFRNLIGSKQETVPNMSAILALLNADEKKYKNRFLIKVGSKLVPIQVNDIAYFFSDEGFTHLVTKGNRTFVADQTLDELDRILDPSSFQRANRQFIVSVDSVKALHHFFKGKLKIDLNPLPEREVIVSRERAKSFKNWLDERN